MAPTFGGFVRTVPTRLPSLARQGLWLLAIDAVTNLADYGFHAYLGRVLAPGDFAAVQTINMTLLVLGTAFGVMQPVVAKYVAALEPDGAAERRRILRYFFGHNLRLGLILMIATWFIRRPLASWLNVPTGTVTLAAASLVFAVSRPTVAGILQGQQRFAAFGLVRSAHAVGRLALCVLLIGLGGGLLSVIAVYPLAGALALAIGVAILGPGFWRGPSSPETHDLRAGWRSSGHALVGYGGLMTMMGSDLVWANRHLAAGAAASYAAIVLLRRVLTVLPAIVVTIFYPKVVRAVERGHSPDRLLLIASVTVVGPTCIGALLYGAYGSTLLDWVFGPGYSGGELLGWMALGMVGFNLGSIWLNLFLATRPQPFVWLVGTLAVVQLGLLSAFHASATQLTLTFGVVGWLLGLGGLLIYVVWLRPRLGRQANRPQLATTLEVGRGVE